VSDESLLPFLSEFDPPVRAEGSIDPLGLYPIAGALVMRRSDQVAQRLAARRTVGREMGVVDGDHVRHAAPVR